MNTTDIDPVSWSRAVGGRCCVVIALRNDDPMFHDLEVEGLANVDVAARPGQTGRLRVLIDKPGTYRFICTVPGHAEAGMVGTLVVD